jgi:hypothetical protein
MSLRPCSSSYPDTRQVAFENGGVFQWDDAPMWLTSNLNNRGDIWLNPTTNIVHLTSNSCYETVFDEEGNRIALFLWAAAKGKVASISANNVHTFLGDTMVTIHGEVFKLLETTKKTSYIVSLQIVNIHVTIDKATRSRLFGTLGEEHVIFVNPFDEQAFRKFRELWLQAPEPDPETEAFFDQVLLSTQFQDRVRKWSDELENLWLRYGWLECYHCHRCPIFSRGVEKFGWLPIKAILGSEIL